jgi:hypothetical protein
VLAGAAWVYPYGYPDPFAPYEALMPGQPLPPEVDSHLCEIQFNVLGPYNSLICDLHPDDDHFLQIRIRVCQGIIQNVMFQARHVQIVDLVRRWGYPKGFGVIDRDERRYMFHWDSGLYASTTEGSRPTYQASVQYVWLGNSQSC